MLYILLIFGIFKMAAVEEEISMGGYSYAFVDNNLPSKYICHICTLVARDPQQVSCCYQVFCKSCLLSYKESKLDFTCPICRKPLSGNYFKDGRIELEIKSLHIYCSNLKCGCQWTGTISDSETHLAHYCLYQPIPCTNDCGKVVQRLSLATHLDGSCPMRIVACQYCKKEGPYRLMTGSTHFEYCPDYCVQCTNQDCHDVIPRRLLGSHLKTCGKAMVVCEYETIGCHKRLKREVMERHYKDDIEDHLMMAVKRLKSTEEEVSRLRNEVNSQKKLIKLSSYSLLKREKEAWYSPGFYTSPESYKLSLCVYANGFGTGIRTHVSFYIHLMEGSYDDTLDWPFKGDVTVELLNQLEDNNHKTQMISFNENISEQRVRKGETYSKGWGFPCFIPHTELNHNPSTNCQYLKGDSLYFRISVKITCQTLPWLK